ncbi:hypothetical protein [Nocardioides yefusunii]|uniref:Bacterial Ig domain-containing protein n=1 Tax=Nocardioides yefusunii TaxID=2500546 RepID=A0ABW1QTZ6_9ACTN|nr:hypothetical protein [Nocardioides yefusunii]
MRPPFRTLRHAVIALVVTVPLSGTALAAAPARTTSVESAASAPSSTVAAASGTRTVSRGGYTLRAPKKVTGVGRKITLTGTLPTAQVPGRSSKRPFVVQARKSGRWKQVGAGKTNAKGAFSVKAKTLKSGTFTYRVVAPKWNGLSRFASAQTTVKIVAKKKTPMKTPQAPRIPQAPQPPKAGGGSVIPSGWDCPSSHPIKGNGNSMIFHVPSGSFYSRTNPEECFASESDAWAAGYRKSQR